VITWTALGDLFPWGDSDRIWIRGGLIRLSAQPSPRFANFARSPSSAAYTHRDLAAKRGIGLAEMDAIAAATGEDRFRPKMLAPHQASIRLLAQERDYFGKGHICSGALVAPSVVLTVGSCIFRLVKCGL